MYSSQQQNLWDVQINEKVSSIHGVGGGRELVYRNCLWGIPDLNLEDRHFKVDVLNKLKEAMGKFFKN